LIASGHELETHALALFELVVFNVFFVETLLKPARYNKVIVRNEGNKWKRFSRQIVDVLLVHLTIGLSKDQSLLDIYSTQLTLFDVVSSFELRPIDPFVVAFRAST
ncbi:unnamed protein product, partial [Rotaria sordida]